MTIRRGDSIIAGNAGGIPSQTGQSGKFLTTNGTTASWGDTVDYTNITNYITEIPQDIKLELNNVTLKLKAGSKVYVPNGFEADGITPKFDVKIIESDIIVDSPYTDEPMFIYYVDNTVVPVPSSWSISGTSNTITDGFSCWYDTTNNIIKIIVGDEVGYSGMSLPLAIVNGSPIGDWTSIDQVFNGFGYIGSTVFALPGVKGLIPNGRNEDGSLKNIEFTVDSVKTYTTINNMPTELVGCWCIQRDNNIGWDAGDYWTYDKQQNLFLHGSEIFYKCDFAYYLLDSNRKIASFTPKTAFHAVDYNEFAPVKDAIPTKQDVATAVNYNNISNCITEIPQDIKLELNNGTLTLKAGSKVYIPNGAGKFDEVIVSSDINLAKNSSGLYFVFMKSNGVLSDTMPFNYCYSSNSQPTITHTYAIWYDTANNKIKLTGDNGSTWTEGYSLPMCIVVNDTPGTQNVSSIDQVFNGFGYIGSTVFALPGVKGLIPNGRNADGSLKSIEVILGHVVKRTNIGTNVVGYQLSIYENTQLFHYDSGYIYDGNNNLIKLHNGIVRNDLICATYSTDSSGKITSFAPKTAFHAVDWNECIHDIDSKQDKSTAVNYNNISNCITEIPQDIKLELNNGTLTLKAGSKVYVPNGVGKFDVVTIANDLSTTRSTNSQEMYFVSNNGTVINQWANIYSGTSAPSGQKYMVWYDTANYIIKVTTNGGSTWISGFSLPVCLATSNNIQITSIDQVFNGFGYIGSTVFALPGVKGLIPNGRNADGSLKSIEVTTNNVLTYTNPSNVSYSGSFIITNNLSLLSSDRIYWKYNQQENLFKHESSAGAFFEFSLFENVNGTITSFTPKTVFHAVDYNDFSDLKNTVGIPSQTGQSGKFLTTNGTTTSWAAVNVDTSDIYNKIDTKQDKSTAVNYNNISNCITEIPQDIKLELNNGVLTLKAGSKVYIPNDAEVFDTLNIASDITLTLGWRTAEKCVLCIYGGNSLAIMSANRCVSGSSDSISGNDHWYYNTTNNTIRFVNGDGTTRQTQMSLPIAIITMAGDGTAKVNSIDQVFNGFGYIGSTVFALPGVKGRIPNGRNADGGLKSIEFVNDRVRTFTASGSGYGLTYFLNSDTTNLAVINSKAYVEKDTKLTTFDNNTGVWFDTKQNIMLQTTDSGTTWTRVNYVCFSYMFMTNAGHLDYLESKTVFHALDYNDKSTISGWGMPSSRYIDLTLGSDGTFYIAPANGYFYFRGAATAANQYIDIENITSKYSSQTNAPDGRIFCTQIIPARKDDMVRITYTLKGMIDKFRFIYAEGE